MNNILKNIVFFIVLVFAQVVVFNNILFWGYLNPLAYILFVFIYPFKKGRGFFLLLSFLLGLSIDFFLDSGGTNAAATLFIAFIRLPVLKSILRKSEIDFQVFNILKLPFFKFLNFIAILTFIHHFIIFSLEYFKFSEIMTILSRTFLTSIFTIILLVFSLLLLNRNK
jgi:rod shape-determining protein MreD